MRKTLSMGNIVNFITIYVTNYTELQTHQDDFHSKHITHCPQFQDELQHGWNVNPISTFIRLESDWKFAFYRNSILQKQTTKQTNKTYQFYFGW